MLGLNGVTEMAVGDDGVDISPPHPLACHVAFSHEVSDYSLGRPLGDADCGRDVPSTEGGITVDADEDVGVIRQKSPVAAPRGRNTGS